MNNLRIHHIGYLVKKIEASICKFEALGYRLQKATVYDEIRDVNICFLQKDGYVVELVSPASNASVVSQLLKRYKNAPYHICYETSDLEASIEEAQEEGFYAIDLPTPAPALEGRRVVFLLSPLVGMIELLEK